MNLVLYKFFFLFLENLKPVILNAMFYLMKINKNAVKNVKKFMINTLKFWQKDIRKIQKDLKWK
jgi:hypothetical protein